VAALALALGAPVPAPSAALEVDAELGQPRVDDRLVAVAPGPLEPLRRGRDLGRQGVTVQAQDEGTSTCPSSSATAGTVNPGPS